VRATHDLTLFTREAQPINCVSAVTAHRVLWRRQVPAEGTNSRDMERVGHLLLRTPYNQSQAQASKCGTI